jgi:cell division protease FtsH
VIDEEVERILREQEDRAREGLRRHRDGLDAVARALLEHETIDGAEVGRLVDEAAGHQVRRRPPRPPDADNDGAPVRAAAGSAPDGARRATR